MLAMTQFARSIAVALALSAGVGGLLAGCQNNDDKAMKSGMEKPGTEKSGMMMSDGMPAKSLYERLGGEPAITAVVEDFVARTAGNPKVNFFRKGTPAEWKPSDAEVAMLKKHLVTFIAMATGGPQRYQGRTMAASHRGMMITDEEFNALAGDLAASLDKFNVPAKEKAELMAIAGSTRKDIVGK